MSKYKKYLLILPVILLLFTGYYSVFLGNESLRVPETSSEVLPPVLFFPHLDLNVLGSQVITPTDIVKYVNIERSKRGEQNLIINDKLMEAAKMRAKVILDHQNFSHQDPFEGIELKTVLPKVDYFYSYASENIGMGGISGEDFVGGFMNSTSHRLNLLNPYLYHTGVAVVTGPYKQYYVNIAVQLFAIPASRDAYLGYNEDEHKKYKKLLGGLKIKLNPGLVFAENLLYKDKAEEKLSKLKRQKEILTVLLAKMEANSPFNQNEVDLVHEYNSYL